MTYLRKKEVASDLADLRSKGCTHLSYHKVDVASGAEVKAWIEAIEMQWGGVAQIVVPNAGIVVGGAFTDAELTIERVKAQMDVNFWGSYHLSVHAAKRMKAEKLPGRISFIGSWVAERPVARISAYCVSKAAVRMLCKTLALDLAADNILVNEVAPGIVEGGLSRKNQLKDPSLLQHHLSAIPVHRLVSVNEVAQHVVQLSSFSNMNVTGCTLVVDGGLTITSKMTP